MIDDCEGLHRIAQDCQDCTGLMSKNENYEKNY
jgi:hypothetical protein